MSVPMQHQCVRCSDAGRERWGFGRYSLGLYAGRYCDECWADSGYRDEGAAGFDAADAGESYDEQW